MGVTKNLVPINRRIDHAADLFGAHFPMLLEPTIYSFASLLSREYRGGYWNFFALSNGGFFMSPDGERYRIVAENRYEGDMSAEAFGITACLYAYSHLSFTDIDGQADEYVRQYHLLREYMLGHPEALAILGAID